MWVGGWGLVVESVMCTGVRGPKDRRCRCVLGVFDSVILVSSDTATSAVFVLKPDRFVQRVALGEVDPVSRSVEGRDCVLAHG